MGTSESRISFVETVNRLLDEAVPPSDSEFWVALFGSPIGIEEVSEIVSPEHVRHLKKKRPANLQVLLQKIVETMAGVCARSDRGVGTMPPADIAAASNCLRLLTRMMPFLLEDPEEEARQLA